MVTCQTCNPEAAGSTPSRKLPGNDLGQVVHTRVTVHQAVQIGTSFTAKKVTAVICGGPALLPYIKQGQVRLYRVAGNTV